MILNCMYIFYLNLRMKNNMQPLKQQLIAGVKHQIIHPFLSADDVSRTLPLQKQAIVQK